MASDPYVSFEHAVQQCFQYLETDFCFQPPQIQRAGSAAIVRFQSPVVYVSLRYGPPSFEVKMHFGRLGIDDQPEAYSFDQGDLSLLEVCRGWKWSPEGTERIALDVAWFAKILEECGRACLLGDANVYEEMKARRDAAVAKWRHEEKLRPLLDRVVRAWVRKEYWEVVEVFSQLQTLGKVLTPLEEKQLAYARKHASKNK
jgi:hypothetical protein